MERRLGRESKGSSLSLQKRMAETRRREEPAPDLTDFMNDIFFGAVDVNKKNYDLTGSVVVDDEDVGFDDSTRSNSARLTQEWLQEARRIVASSPARCESPVRLFGSPRFAAAQPQPGSPLHSLDQRDSISRARSARRFRAAEGISGEILSKSAKHSRNKSDTFAQPTSPASDVDPLPPLQRKSRFQTEPSDAPHPQGIQTPSRRTFKTRMPSPSGSLPLSPPRKLVESAHRRTISSSTCSLEKVAPRHVTKVEEVTRDNSLNGFLKQQRVLFQKISNGELHANAKVVLSGPSNSTASMVAAICYAWLLGYREREKEGRGSECVVVPVMNVKRGFMWKLRQAAWLFHHAGLDATTLLFADQVDMESLLVAGQLSVVVVGQDVLSSTGEVGSQCTVLTDNYCEDAYDLLQNPVLKKLLLAGILLDTQNLKASASISMTRDAEAVQLLLVGSAPTPNYRYALFDQLMQDQNTTSFVEALNLNYGKPPDESDQNGEGNMERKDLERKFSSTSDRETIMSSPKTNYIDSKGAKTDKVSPKPAKLISPPLQSPSPAPAPPAPAHAEKEVSRGKNKFFLARWFGFGSK